jgi:hypothetical protein
MHAALDFSVFFSTSGIDDKMGGIRIRVSFITVVHENENNFNVREFE